jgi:hypothetical protein
MKTKCQNPFLFIAAAALLFSLQACDPLGVRARGDLITETRDVENFHALEVNVPGDVEVRVDSQYWVEVTCEDNVIDYLETIEDNGVLKIHFDRDVFDVDNLKIIVHAPSWDGFEINGSADVHVKDAIIGDQLEVQISGSGDLELYNADFLKAKASISGSGDLELSGKADELTASVAGSGEIDALDFPVKRATIVVSGSGNIRLDVSESLNATVSGSGNIYYQGNPQVSSSVSGSGNIRKL